jgi:glycosyltransferase involved in cell wall biosynthesis
MTDNAQRIHSGSKLRIAIKAVQITTGGGLTHLNKIIEWFGKLAPDTEFMLLGKKGQEKFFIPAPDNFKYIYYCLPGLNLPMQIFWERQILPGILSRMGIDLLFEPGNRGTLKTPCPKVSLIHNVAPFVNPFQLADTRYNRLRLTLLRQATLESMNASQGIIFISKSSRDMLAEQIDLNSKKNTVIYHGRMDSEPDDNLTRVHLNLPPRYLLCVSHIYRYKKIKEMVQAYCRAQRSKFDIPPLLIAGNNYAPQYMNEITDEINKSEQPGSIRMLGNIPEAELWNLYQNCEAFFFPSVLEACPNILIEALSCGCAIACSNKSVMPEIAGDAAIYFNPDNIEEFANIILSIVQNKKLKEQLSLKAVQRAAFFSWEKTARQTLDFFDEVLGKKRSFSQVKSEQRQLAEAGQEVTLT